ncbi:cytidylyltransferase domain-containing protein [Microbacterium sp. NPDC055357]
MVLALVQARMSSSRLPGKVLADLDGEPMIIRQLERINQAETVERVVVVTSVDPSDDVLVEALSSRGVEVFRGALADVLGRYLAAAESLGAEHLLRLTADCPLTDPDVIDEVVRAHGASDTDYASNVLVRTYPRGLDVESVTTAALRRVAEVATDQEREHVTLGIYRRPELFTLTSVVQPESRSDLRWTVDTPADLAFVREVYEQLRPRRGEFTSADVHELLARRPELSHREPQQP